MATDIYITGIRIRPLLVPIRRPLAVSFGLFSEGPFLAIELETRGGVHGTLLAFTFHKLGLKLLPPLLQHLVEQVKDQPVSVATMPAFHDACQKRLMLLGHEGLTQMALSMFDIVVYDALAKANGAPLYKLLGASAVDLSTYNSCGGGLLSREAGIRDARELADMHGGFAHVKLRADGVNSSTDLARLTAIREALGPAAILSLDFNQAVPSAHAYEIVQKYDGLGLAWIEEPVVYDDYTTQARLAAKLRTPLQVGETWWHWRVGKRAIEDRACDYIMPDILRIGGITGWNRLAAVAAQHAIPMSSHLSPEVSAHLLAATPTRHWLEFMDWGQDLLIDPTVPDHGIARPSEKPGIGIAFDEARIARHVVTP